MPTNTRELSAHRSGVLRVGGDLPIHRLGYGAMRLTGPGIWGDPPDRDNAIAVLRRAVELGVDFIDTAEAYGPWTNEELIRQALHPYSGLVIATKGGGIRPGPDEWEALGRPGFIRQGVETSLRRLGVECLDLYQLHRIDPEVPLADTLGTLKELQEAGKIRHVGLSEVDTGEIESARETVDIVSVQNRYGLDFREWEHVIDHCSREDITFIAWGPLGSGTRDPLQTLGQAEGLAGVSATRIALAWLLHRAENTVAIPGTASLRHLEENVAAAGLRLTDEQFEQLGTTAVAGSAESVPSAE